MPDPRTETLEEALARGLAAVQKLRDILTARAENRDEAGGDDA